MERQYIITIKAPRSLHPSQNQIHDVVIALIRERVKQFGTDTKSNFEFWIQARDVAK